MSERMTLWIHEWINEWISQGWNQWFKLYFIWIEVTRVASVQHRLGVWVCMCVWVYVKCSLEGRTKRLSKRQYWYWYVHCIRQIEFQRESDDVQSSSPCFLRVTSGSFGFLRPAQLTPGYVCTSLPPRLFLVTQSEKPSHPSVPIRPSIR